MDKDKIGAFEEIIDLIESELDSNESEGLYTTNYADSEVNSFLEYEEQRLTKLDNLISRKMKNLIESPQTAKLLDAEVAKMEKSKAELVKAMTPPSSGVNQELNRMFRSMFGVFQNS